MCILHLISLFWINSDCIVAVSIIFTVRLRLYVCVCDFKSEFLRIHLRRLPLESLSAKQSVYRYIHTYHTCIIHTYKTNRIYRVDYVSLLK